MLCPLCCNNFSLVDDTIPRFCPICGGEFSEKIKKQIQKPGVTPLSKASSLPIKEKKLSKSPKQDLSIDNKEDNPVPSADQGSTPTVEYRNLVETVFSSGKITPEQIRLLISKKNELGIDDGDAVEIQKDVGQKIGLDVSDNPELMSGEIFLEVNVGKKYYVGERGNLEFRLSSISTEDIYLDSIKGKFAQTEKERDIPFLEKKLAPGMKSKSILYLPFNAYEDAGEESVYIHVIYEDRRKNPSVYMAQLQFRVFGGKKKYQGDGMASVNISINAEKIIGSDFKQLSEIAGRGSDEDTEIKKAAENSFYLETTQEWQRLPLLFQEEETNKLRNDVIIRKKWQEGEEQAGNARKLQEEAENLFIHNRQEAKTSLKKAMEAFTAANACFYRIMEINPEHAEAKAKVIEVEKNIAEVKRRHDVLAPSESESKFKFTSAMLTLPRVKKKIFIYSKPLITIGKHSGNDMVLRLLPYQPKEQYPENYRKSNEISRCHAEIINDEGIFYLRDVSKNGTFLDGKKVSKREKDHLLHDGCRINVAGVLDLCCNFIWKAGKKNHDYKTTTGCVTVMGDISDSCFGIDKQGAVNAIRITRLNNLSREEEYIILIREITIGRSAGNGVVIDDDSVSDIHAKIFYRDSRYWIEDLNSRYGTRVREKLIVPGAEVSLDKQSSILIGEVPLEYVGRY